MFKVFLYRWTLFGHHRCFWLELWNFFPTKSPHEVQGGWRHFSRPVLHRPHLQIFGSFDSLIDLIAPVAPAWTLPKEVVEAKKGWFKTLNKVKILKSHEITTIFKASGGGTRIFCNLQFVFVASLQSVDPGNSLSWVPTKIGCYTSLRDLISVLFKKRRGNNSTFCRARLHKSKTTFFFGRENQHLQKSTGCLWPRSSKLTRRGPWRWWKPPPKRKRRKMRFRNRGAFPRPVESKIDRPLTPRKC